LNNDSLLATNTNINVGQQNDEMINSETLFKKKLNCLKRIIRVKCI